jgi:transposase-like protein
MRGRTHDVRTRAVALAALLTGETVSGAAKASGISRATARAWWRAYRQTDAFVGISATVAAQFATKKGGVGIRLDFTDVRDPTNSCRGE